jgi:hypothetical protein
MRRMRRRRMRRRRRENGVGDVYLEIVRTGHSVG